MEFGPLGISVVSNMAALSIFTEDQHGRHYVK